MWIMLISLAVSAALQAQDSCACLCMNGEPTTLCTTVEHAQEQLSLCSLAHQCPQVEPIQRSDPLPPPSGEALNCRAVRIWDAQYEQFRTVNVCDVRPTMAN